MRAAGGMPRAAVAMRLRLGDASFHPANPSGALRAGTSSKGAHRSRLPAAPISARLLRSRGLSGLVADHFIAVGGLMAQGPFVGRVAELDRMEDFQHRVQAGSGGLLLLEGPAGIGKSALMTALRGPRLVTLPSVVVAMPLGGWCSSTRRGTRAAPAAPLPAPGRAP